ncbi:hypothetical protein F5879DRAFT_1071801 [Lentinula edodes]|nr:hypothetical protein F5879DRAFT_1071801 [Lentinula edodes]
MIPKPELQNCLLAFIQLPSCTPSSVISGTHREVYALLDDVIGPLDECEIFKYIPDPEDDPNAGEGEEDGDEDFEDGFEGYSPDEEHPHSTLSTPVTPRDAVLSTTANPISPSEESSTGICYTFT